MASWLERATDGYLCMPWEQGDEYLKEDANARMAAARNAYDQQCADVDAENKARADQNDHGLTDLGEGDSGPYSLGRGDGPKPQRDQLPPEAYPPDPEDSPQFQRDDWAANHVGPLDSGPQYQPVTTGPRAKAKAAGGPAGTGVIEGEDGGGEDKNGYNIEYPDIEFPEAEGTGNEEEE